MPDKFGTGQEARAEVAPGAAVGLLAEGQAVGVGRDTRRPLPIGPGLLRVGGHIRQLLDGFL